MVLEKREYFVNKYIENFIVLPSTSDTVQLVSNNFLHWAGHRAFIAGPAVCRYFPPDLSASASNVKWHASKIKNRFNSFFEMVSSLLFEVNCKHVKGSSVFSINLFILHELLYL